MSVRVRFAPSPTGFLHVGNVRTALFNWLFARHRGGTFILRVEDTDAERSDRRYEVQLCEDLRWLGLDWDEGVMVGGKLGPYRQSDRYPLYRQFAARLLEQGRAYRCFCSGEQLESDRKEQMERGLPLQYIGRCRNLDPDYASRRAEAGEPFTLRFRIRPGRVAFEDLVFGPIEIGCDQVGDFIILRSDGSPQYNFAVVIDDLGMEISHVIRGEGHISNTHRQVLIYEALEAAPPQFAHLSTILGPDGSKLSKRHGATSIEEFREQGYLPVGLVNYLALLGFTPANDREVLPVDDLIAEFELQRVNRNPATFDREKLDYVNRTHLRDLSELELAEAALPWLQGKGWAVDDRPEVLEWLSGVVALLKKYLEKLSDIPRAAAVFFDFNPGRDLLLEDARSALEDEAAIQVIRVFAEELESASKVDAEGYRAALDATQTRTGAKGRHLFHPIRIALTASTAGPALDRMVELLEAGDRLSLPVVGVRQRVQRVLEALE